MRSLLSFGQFCTNIRRAGLKTPTVRIWPAGLSLPMPAVEAQNTNKKLKMSITTYKSTHPVAAKRKSSKSAPEIENNYVSTL